MAGRAQQAGVSLIEVLIALLVFSAGLLAVAAMLGASARAAHSAYLRTQASLLAEAMSARMRVNPLGVWRGLYDGAYPRGAGGDCDTGCDAAALASYDRGRWSQQLTSTLSPSARALIQCHPGGAVAPGDQMRAPAYDGYCKLSLYWPARAPVLGAGEVSEQRLAWVFQP